MTRSRVRIVAGILVFVGAASLLSGCGTAATPTAASHIRDPLRVTATEDPLVTPVPESA